MIELATQQVPRRRTYSGRDFGPRSIECIGIGIQIGVGTGGATAAAAAPSTPLTIISSVPVLAWYRGDTVTQSSNLVSNWKDKTTNGNDAVQATGANQPAYNAADATLNNQPTLTGNGTSTELLCVGGVIPVSYWMCCVAKIISFSSGNNQAFSSPGGSGRAALYWNAVNALYCFEQGSFDGPVTTTANVWKRISMAQSNAATDYIKYGSLSATGALGRTTTSNAWRFFDNNGSYWNGALAEAIITTGIPSSAEQTAIDTYLSGRYLASLLT